MYQELGFVITSELRELLIRSWCVKRTTEYCISEWDETKKEGSFTAVRVAEKPVSEGMFWTSCSPWAVTDVTPLPSSFTPSSLKQLSQPKVCL